MFLTWMYERVSNDNCSLSLAVPSQPPFLRPLPIRTTLHLQQIKSLLQTITTAEKQARSLGKSADAVAVGAILRDARNVMTGLGPGGDL